jgi:hypothetical protein
VLKSGKSLLVLSSYILLGALVFHPALRIGFLGDFAGDLYTSQGSWLNFAAYQWNFYVPALAIYSSLYKTFHLSPLPYHVFHLSLIVINAWLIYILAQELEFASWQCWVAGLLALFNSAAFETYFWLSTIPKVLSTGFGLVALIFLSRFRQRKALIWGWGYVVMVTIGLTMESTGLILPLLGFALDTYYRPWRVLGKAKTTIFSGLRLHFWTFSIVGIFLYIRQWLGIKPYAENRPLIQKFLTFGRSISSTFFQGFPDYLDFIVKGISLTSIILIILLMIMLVLAWHVKQGPDRKRFVALLLLWMGACLPHTIGSHFHSRYLYFPGVFAALVLVDLLGSFRLSLFARNCTWLVISLIITGYLSVDIYAFRHSLSYYLDASKIYNAGINKIVTYLPHMPYGTRLVLIDFPDYIYRPRNIHHSYVKKYPILVYRNALPYHLLLLYHNANFTVTLLKLSPPSNDAPFPLGTPSSPEQVAELLASPKTVACRYLPGNPGSFAIARGGPTLDFLNLR